MPEREHGRCGWCGDDENGLIPDEWRGRFVWICCHCLQGWWRLDLRSQAPTFFPPPAVRRG